MEIIKLFLERGFEELKQWNKGSRILEAKEIIEHFDGKQWRTFIK